MPEGPLTVNLSARVRGHRLARAIVRLPLPFFVKRRAVERLRLEIRAGSRPAKTIPLGLTLTRSSSSS